MNTENTSDPAVHIAHVKEQLHALIEHLRTDIPRLPDPKAKALFEVSAEVLIGLEKAFSDFAEQEETAWR